LSRVRTDNRTFALPLLPSSQQLFRSCFSCTATQDGDLNRVVTKKSEKDREELGLSFGLPSG
jgi:hypothetical protein